MGNALSIAVVTATLRRTLQAAVNADVSGVKVTTLRPDSLGAAAPAPSVNIFLYQVTPNAARRNEVLPNRNGNADVVQRPRAAVDLHYLLSFYGSEAELEPQRLLGGVIRTLNSRPLITRHDIRDMLGDAMFAFLAGANLADDEEVVRLTPAALSLEELSKLWSVFFQTPYALSVAYQAAVVTIEADEITRAALPVRERTLTVLPFRTPIIDDVQSTLGAQLPVLAGATLQIRGRQMRGDVTRLRITGDEVVPTTLTDEQVTVTLPTTLRAGVNSLQVVQKLMIGNPPSEHAGFDSNVAAFVLHPRITGITPGAGTFQIKVDPVARATQRTVLLLNNTTTGSAHTFELPPLTADTATLNFAVSGLEAGAYFVRVQVGGVESSLLDLNPASPTFKQLIAPQVTLP